MRFFLVLLVAATFGCPAFAQSTASAPVPPAARSEAPVAFVAHAWEVPTTVIALPSVDLREIASAKSANSQRLLKRLQIGVGRSVRGLREASSDALEWREVDAGHVARWAVTSPGAEALRVELVADALPQGIELRFLGSGDPATVYGPFSEADFVAGNRTFWSPVLDGQVATVEVFAPLGVQPSSAAIAITRVSHQFVSMRDSGAEVRAKDAGDSTGCSPDLICESATNTPLANVGKAVARMNFVDPQNGFSYLCTGTLIQSTDGTSTPYFYSAAHCIDTQAAANTLTTHWFFDRAACNSGGASTNPPSVQRTGGATLLYPLVPSDPDLDVLLLRLNSAPPAGAWFAGWDANAFSLGASATGIHHPRGDLKKVSRGTVAGFPQPVVPYGSMTRINWASGLTEGGSSGSGLFGAVGSPPTDYRLRGGLWGGPAPNCSGTNYDFYSRLDIAYNAIREWIDPPPPPPNTLTVTKAGTGTGVVQSSPPGINCGGSCSAIFAANAMVTLTAIPEPGSIFIGWGGACSGTTGCAVTMDAGRSVSATFSPQPANAALTVTRSGTGTVTSSQGGINCGPTCAVEVAFGQVLTLNAAASPGFQFAGWSGGGCSGLAPCTITMNAARSINALFNATALTHVVDVSTTTIAFGGQSMGTTAPGSSVVITNIGSNTVIFSGIGTNSGQYGQTGNCTNIAPGTSCTLNVTFTPAITGIALGQALPVTGQLSVPSNAAGQPHLVALSGSAEKSLVSHYYRSILRRAPDAGGKAYWEAEAQRLVSLGIDVNEAWFAMAQAFYGSAEYAALNRGSAAFVTDLYTTFFNRAPDGGGLGFWNQEIVNGMPRGVALASFMFSTEFRNFSQGIFGGAAVRPEVDAVVDFYRGLLGRPPDSGGFAFWLQRFRAAQCSGQAAVVSEVEAISYAFANSAEYMGRTRSQPDYVGDLYNAFLRRGGELAGVQFWINQVATAAQTREQVRVQFRNSAEFQARVSAILAAPCLP